LIVLLPLGVSGDALPSLRASAFAAGWNGGTVWADGAVFFAATQAWLDSRDRSVYAVFRHKRNEIEASLVEVTKESGMEPLVFAQGDGNCTGCHSERCESSSEVKNLSSRPGEMLRGACPERSRGAQHDGTFTNLSLELNVRLLRQSRASRVEQAEDDLYAETSEVKETIVRPSEPAQDELLVEVARYAAEIRSGKNVMNVERRGKIGLRIGVKGLHAVLDETMSIMTERRHQFICSDRQLPMLDFWFGYPGLAVHRVGEVELASSSRPFASSHNISVTAEKIFDGRVNIQASADEGPSTGFACTFPIILL